MQKAFQRFFWFLLFVFVGLTAFRNQPPAPDTFQSAWIEITPGQTLIVAHDLNHQPAFASVMVKQMLLSQEGAGRDFETIRPHTDLPDRPLVILDISPLDFTLLNTSLETWVIQVNLH